MGNFTPKPISQQVNKKLISKVVKLSSERAENVDILAKAKI